VVAKLDDVERNLRWCAALVWRLERLHFKSCQVPLPSQISAIRRTLAPLTKRAIIANWNQILCWARWDIWCLGSYDAATTGFCAWLSARSASAVQVAPRTSPREKIAMLNLVSCNTAKAMKTTAEK